MSELVFYVNGKKVMENNPSPTTLLSDYLRYKLRLTGSKVSCGEGGCGSCTVMVSWFDRSTSEILHYSVNACIFPICLLHGLAVTTVEAVGSTKTRLHELQERLVYGHGIQCGFCTPGMVMSMYALLRTNPQPTELQIEHALKGNLCRCTGYRPILDAFRSFSKDSKCPMGDRCCKNQDKKNSSQTMENCEIRNESNSGTQELIFPSELQLSDSYDQQTLEFKSDEVTWLRPVCLKDLLFQKKQYPGALIVAGGTNVVFYLKNASGEKPLVIIATTQVKELRSFEEKEDGLSVGAMTSMTLLENKLISLIDKLPEARTRLFHSLLDALHLFGSPQIRNRATIGGSLATASASADVNALLLAAGSSVKIASIEGEREVKLQDFFTGSYTTCLKLDEVIIDVLLPFSTPDDYYGFYKQSPRKDMALAEINAGFLIEFGAKDNSTVKNANFVFGGLLSMLVVAKKSSSCVIGRKLDGNLLDELMLSLADELGQYVSGDEAKSFKVAVAQGFIFKFFLRISYQRFPKLDTLRLFNEEEKYLLSSQADLQQRHSGVQIYDKITNHSEMDSVGKPVPHRFAKQCATGEAVFIDDILPSHGELYLTLVTSTKANAKLLKIDPSKALAMKGVVSFLDHTSTVNSNKTGMNSTEEIFATKMVNFVGQTIGAVVAESHEISRKAARAVVIEYEELQPILTIEDAISKDSFHPWHENMGAINYGDVSRAFSSCDHVIEGELKIGGQEHFYMETHSVRVVPQGEDGEMDIYCGAQFATGIQIAVASALNVPCNKIVVHTKRMGGAFGGKEFRSYLVTLPSALAAHRFNRPVRCFLERRQDMQITGYRRPYLAKFKVGFNNDGKVLALSLDMYSNDGFHPELSPIFMAQSLFYSDNCYAIPNIYVRGHLCKTNLPPTTAMRGAGIPQAVIICEYWMTKVADFLKRPQHKIREINMYRGGDVTFISIPIEDSMTRCFDEALKQSSYEQALVNIENFNQQSAFLKKGIAITPVKFSPGLPPSWCKAGAIVNVYLDGSVLLYHGGVESGQGLHTKMIQIASRALDLSIDKIHISETSTGVIPNSVTTGGSSGTDLNGAAVLDACNQLMARLKPIKDSNPNGKWEDWVKTANEQKINLSASGYYNHAYSEDFDWNTGKGRPYSYYTYGSAVTQVEIDCLSGSYVILKVDIVMDVGKSLNPAIDVGQIEGAFVMGTGLYALEEHCFGPDGHLETSGAGKYHIPTISSIPLEMNVSLLKDSGNPQAIYSSKCIGEPPLLLSNSVFFAIQSAVSAARRQAGLSPDFVLNSPATAKEIQSACGVEPWRLFKSLVA